MTGRRRVLYVGLVALAVVIAFAAGTMSISGSPTGASAAPAALTSGQQVAVQTSNWLMTTRVINAVYLPLVIRNS